MPLQGLQDLQDNLTRLSATALPSCYCQKLKGRTIIFGQYMLLYYVEKDSRRIHFYYKIREDRNVIVSGWEGESFSTRALLQFFFCWTFHFRSCPTQDARLRTAGCFATQNPSFSVFCRNYFLVQRELSLICLLLQENLMWSQNI